MNNTFPKLPSIGGRPAYDLRNQRFGMLLVLGLVDPNISRYWECRCDCGSPVVRSSSYLLCARIKTPSCGCAPWGRPRLTAAERLRRQQASPTWPLDLHFKDDLKAIRDKGSQPRINGRPPKGSREIVQLGTEMRWIATLSEAELAEAARLTTAQACKVKRERKRRAAEELTRRPMGRPCKDADRDAARVAAWHAAGRPQPAPKTYPVVVPQRTVKTQFDRIETVDRHPELHMPDRLALVKQHALERHAA